MAKLHKIWTRDYDVYLCYGASKGLYHNKKQLKYATKEVVIFPDGKNKALYLTEEDYQKQYNSLNKYYLDNINHFLAYVKELLKAGQSFVKRSIKQSKNVSKLDNQQLVGRYQQIQDALVDYFGHLWITFIVNELISDRVTNTVNSLDLSKEEKQDLLAYATQPTKPASIMLLAQESGNKSIKQLTKDFCWITTLNIYDDAATEKDIEHRITTKEKDLIKKQHIPKELQSLIKASRENAYLKDRRDDYRRMGTYHAIPLYEEIAKRLKLTRKELAFLTPHEIVKGLLKDDHSLESKAKIRPESGFMMWWNNHQLVFEDNIAKIEDFKKRFGLIADTRQNVSTLEGRIGCRGRTTGKVKVVTTTKELNKIHHGDIMVSVTTNPDYLPGMEKAAAFVTDEGGITCHAAIVAREMKKPCITGTKIATRVFKDGDLVEVDANKGVVRKIK